ncbi:MAG: anthranilate synthase component I [Pseudomonadota bacterium]
MTKHEYVTQAGIKIIKTTEVIDYQLGLSRLLVQLNQKRGGVFTSNFEYPGRYNRWEYGFVNPPIVFESRANQVKLTALNKRGEILLVPIYQALKKLAVIDKIVVNNTQISADVIMDNNVAAEEFRSQKPTIFSVIRCIIDLFRHDEEMQLGLYGAFGYDLVFQFETLNKSLVRTSAQRDCVLYLPDEIYSIDHQQKIAHRHYYNFIINDKQTQEFANETTSEPFNVGKSVSQSCDHQAGEYAQLVNLAKEKFKCGDLFEVVPSQTFFHTCEDQPADIFQRIQIANPSPYGFLLNLGQQEFLIGASPEMYVRVSGQRVETCPISGTIARGKDALADAKQIQALINSKKDEAELTMCTDVDRNDKSRICLPGSVQIIGRRQIEMYSRLIHTVDHIEGYLQPGYDALDAFLTHMWVVTVTGAPKLWAMQFIEDHEKSPRRWYAGAVGMLLFNGNINTGLTIRTIQINQGIAEIRAGATLLYDSDPQAEEKETRLKASALINALKKASQATKSMLKQNKCKQSKKVLLVDHQDSFVHTLANYIKQTGADVTTVRDGFAMNFIDEYQPDLVFLSPGPGKPDDFQIKNTIKYALDKNIPLFGVCLGLQAIVEYFGGKLNTLEYPMHGKASRVNIKNHCLFANLPQQFLVGRYHSLYANKKTLPNELNTIAETEDNIIMAIAHQALPIWAVQFHPESILSLDQQHGLNLIHNLMEQI